jgi:AcrR family transcriptional regulator
MGSVTATEDRTRARLVAAAAECFAAHGIARVPLEEVATAAGVHRTTLHRHFPGGRAEAEQMATEMFRRIDGAATAADALVDAAAFAVMEGRRSQVVAVLLGEPGAQVVLIDAAPGQLRSTAVAVWERIVARDDASLRSPRPPSAARVVDHLFRVILSLVEQPGDLRTEAKVRSYLADFVAPSLLATA